MIDYEFAIKRLERELAHYRELQQIQSAHQDTNDRSIEALSVIVSRTEANIEALTANVAANEHAIQQLTSNVAAHDRALQQLTANVNALVEALLREHPNGR